MKRLAAPLLILTTSAIAMAQTPSPSATPPRAAASGVPEAYASATPSKNPTVPSMKFDDKGVFDMGFVKKHEKFVEIAKKNDSPLLFLGDSITERWAKPGAAEIFEANFGMYHPANFGITSDCTQHVLWRITNGELDGYTPKVIVLLIGTNNATSVEGVHMIKGVTKVVETIREKSPESKILLMSIFPRGEQPNPLRAKVTIANEGIAKLNDGQTVFYMDIADKFLEPDGVTISRETMSDFLHLTPKGYQIWADAIKPKVDELMK